MTKYDKKEIKHAINRFKDELNEFDTIHHYLKGYITGEMFMLFKLGVITTDEYDSICIDINIIYNDFLIKLKNGNNE